VPWLTYAVTDAPPGDTVTITWVDPAGPAGNVVQAGLPLSGKILWPGAVVDSHGDPTDWPGWTFTGGVWVQGDEWDWVRPSVSVIVSISGGGSIDSHMAGPMVRFGGAVSAAAPVDTPIAVGYPPPTPTCNADPANAPARTPPPTDTLNGGGPVPHGTSWLLVLGIPAGALVVILALTLGWKRRRS
jgi:hypothetical protein